MEGRSSWSTGREPVRFSSSECPEEKSPNLPPIPHHPFSRVLDMSRRLAGMAFLNPKLLVPAGLFFGAAFALAACGSPSTAGGGGDTAAPTAGAEVAQG